VRRPARISPALGVLCLAASVAAGTAGCRTEADGATPLPRSGVPRQQVVARLVASAHRPLADGATVQPAGAARVEVVTHDGRSYTAVTLKARDSRIVWPLPALPHGGRLELGAIVRGPAGASGSVELRAAAELAERRHLELWTARLLLGDPREEVRHVRLDLPPLAAPTRLLLESRSVADRDPAAAPEVSWLGPRVLAAVPAWGPNIVVVCVDTLRADRVGSGPAAAMPRLAQRLKSAAWFPRAYANASWSLPSMASILTGLYPSQHHAGRRQRLGPARVETDYQTRPSRGGIELTIRGEVYRFQMLHPSVAALQDLLGAAGYRTVAIHSNGYVGPPTAVLDEMDLAVHYPPDAEQGSDTAIALLREVADSRFFLFLHYIDPHQWPREIPLELQGKELEQLTAADRKRILAVYDGLVGRTDRQLDRFFAALDQLDLAAETAIIFVADHGERFFEKGVVGSHGGSHYESVLRVPLALWLPGTQGGEVRTRVSTVDIAPTVLELVGIVPPATLSGRSLLPLNRPTYRADDRDFFAEFVLWSADETALVAGRWKYVARAAGGDLLFDLAADPTEEREVAARHPAIASQLHRRVAAHVREGRSGFRALTYPRTELDRQTIDSLRALGYVD
jgi:choline-sulfatase